MKISFCKLQNCLFKVAHTLVKHLEAPMMSPAPVSLVMKAMPRHTKATLLPTRVTVEEENLPEFKAKSSNSYIPNRYIFAN